MKNRVSSWTSWIIRILLAVIFLIVISLLIFSNMGGTSEHHKKGLEQAFSDSLGADVEIVRIEEFNIMPQLSLKMGGVHGVLRDTKNEFMVDKLEIAFGLWDLATGHARIENFQLNNFRFSKDSAYDFKIIHAGIEATKEPSFSAIGEYGGQSFDVKMPLLYKNEARPSYYFGDKNSFTGHYGSLDIKGDVIPSNQKDAGIVENVELLQSDQVIAKGHGVRDGKIFKIALDCVKKDMPASQHKEFKSISKIPFITLSESCPK